MKNLTFLLVLTILSSSLIAQKSTKKQELGFTFSSLYSYGITYKAGNDKALFRLRLMNVNVRHISENPPQGVILKDISDSYGASLALGFEIRKELSDNLELRTGIDGFINYNHFEEKVKNTNSDVSTTSYKRKVFTKGINYVLGFYYNLNDDFIIGAEILPAFSHTNTTVKYGSNGEERKEGGFNFNLSTSSANITLAFKF